MGFPRNLSDSVGAFDVDVDIIQKDRAGIDRSLDSSRFRAGTGFEPQFWPEQIREMADDVQCVRPMEGSLNLEGKGNVTLRDETERLEIIGCGSGILTGADRYRIVTAVSANTAGTPRWTPPQEYLEPHVAATVTGIVLGYAHALDGRQSADA